MSLDDIIKDLKSRKQIEICSETKRGVLFKGAGKARAVFDMLSILTTTVNIKDAEYNEYDEFLYSNGRN